MLGHAEASFATTWLAAFGSEIGETRERTRESGTTITTGAGKVPGMFIPLDETEAVPRLTFSRHPDSQVTTELTELQANALGGRALIATTRSLLMTQLTALPVPMQT